MEPHAGFAVHSAGLLLTALLSACVPLNPPAVPEARADANNSPLPATRTAESQPRPEVLELLAQADLALRELRLTTPPDNNAWYRYLRVLTLNKGNSRALQGISDIVDQYLLWSLQEVNQGNLKKAREFLSLAVGIDDRHPSIAAVENRIHTIMNRDKQLIAISPADVSAQSIELGRKLSRIGRSIPRDKGQVVIRCRSDREGRWIYQQLAGTGEMQRLRARILFEDPPSVTIIIDHQGSGH